MPNEQKTVGSAQPLTLSEPYVLVIETQKCTADELRRAARGEPPTIGSVPPLAESLAGPDCEVAEVRTPIAFFAAKATVLKHNVAAQQAKEPTKPHSKAPAKPHAEEALTP